MDIYRFIHIISRKLKVLLIVPIIAGALMAFLTRNQKLEYSTHASIFTAITAKSSLDELDDSRVDFFATKAAYNNFLSILSSRNVTEETSLRLLASHLMLKQSQANVLSQKSYDDLQRIIPDDIKKLVVEGDTDKTYNNLKETLLQDKTNFLYGLLNFDHPHYSHKAISTIKAVQDGSSDIVELEYKCNDPAVAYQTLNVFIDVLLRTYGELKKNQTNAVVEYFERQLRKASADLNDAENRLLQFNKDNNIINYYEQTKHISSQQEKIEMKLQEVLMDYRGSEAVLQKLEIETQNRFKVNLKNKEILSIRKELIVVNQKIAEIELFSDDSIPVARDQSMYQRKNVLESRLRGKLDSLFIFEHNTDGVNLESLLNDWLKTVIEHENNHARLMVIQNKSDEFKNIYSQYAPLGSVLKRIEREIDVKERAYLEILHHLGLAKLKQQNEELISNMKVLDKPQLPIDPEPTKRKLFIVVIAVFSFVLTLLGIMLIELLDKTIRSVKRMQQITGLDVAAAIAAQATFDTKFVGDINLKGLKRVLEEIVNKKNQQKNSIIVQVISNWHNDGKSFFISLITRQLSDLGYKTAVVGFNDLPQTESVMQLSIKETFSVNTYRDLIAQHPSIVAEIVFIEVLQMSDTIYNTALFSSASLSYFVADAGRSWSSADQHLFDTATKHPIPDLYGIINRVKPDDMEEYLGELPKKRSRLRVYVKQRIFRRFIS